MRLLPGPLWAARVVLSTGGEFGSCGAVPAAASCCSAPGPSEARPASAGGPGPAGLGPAPAAAGGCLVWWKGSGHKRSRSAPLPGRTGEPVRNQCEVSRCCTGTEPRDIGLLKPADTACLLLGETLPEGRKGEGEGNVGATYATPGTV